MARTAHDDLIFPSAAQTRRERLALGLAAIPFALHLVALTKYDFFRDELYFIVCGRHPAFGYIDLPPVIPWLATASQSAGESLWLMRIIPALMHAGAVLAACAVARVLGGGRAAQIVAGIATGTAPLLLGITATLTTTSIEPLTWTLVAYSALRAVVRDQPRWWIVAGIVAGISLEAKYTIAFLLAALGVGVAVAGPRRTLRRPEFLLGAAISSVIAAPSLVWQTLHGWPFLELLRAGANGKNAVLAPLPWLLDQMLVYSPAYAPLWLAGIVELNAVRQVRFLGIAVLALFATFMALHAKFYYAAGLYPILFAAGGVMLERAVRNPFVRTAYGALAIAGALALVPLDLPLLPEPAVIAYTHWLHRTLGIQIGAGENHREAALPQVFADMHGWRELADRVAVVERSLTPAERGGAAVYAQNYGEAAALDVFGDSTIPVICGHNSYYLWGPHGDHAVLIIVGGERRDHERAFRDVRRVATVRTPYAMPNENDLPVFVAREPKIELTRLWPKLRLYV